MQDSLKDKVLGSVDIVELIQESVSLTRRGKEFTGLCPFHADHKPSMHVSPAKQIFKCFACGAGGDAIKFVQLRERLSFPEALAELARRAGISLAEDPAEQRDDAEREQVRKAVLWAQRHFYRNLRETPAGRGAHDYALHRGLTAETIERHQLGLAPHGWDDLLRAAQQSRVPLEILDKAGLITTGEGGKPYDRFRNRLIFPINDNLGRPIAFGGRTLGDDPAKYLNSPESFLFSKSRVLYALDLAKDAIAARREVVVVEGYLDAVLLHQFGFPNTVAVLGTALTDSHVRGLKRRADRLILCFDGDEAGGKAADRALETSLLGGVEVCVVVLKDGLDPADFVLQRGAEAFSAALRQAAGALEFKWAVTKRQFQRQDAGGERAAVETLIAFIARIARAGGINPLEQGLLVRRLCDLLALPAESVYAMLSSALRRTRTTAPAAENTSADSLAGYARRTQGLPGGLVIAAESVLGLLMTDAAFAGQIDDRFGEALPYCATWSRLYDVVANLVEEQGAYTRADVVARCEDAELCELIDAACRRIDGVRDGQAAFVAGLQRLAEELDTLRMDSLRRRLHQSDLATQPADTFGQLLQTARAQKRGHALAAQTRLQTPA